MKTKEINLWEDVVIINPATKLAATNKAVLDWINKEPHNLPKILQNAINTLNTFDDKEICYLFADEAQCIISVCNLDTHYLERYEKYEEYKDNLK